MNWRSRPLTDSRTIVELIAATTTTSGLRPSRIRHRVARHWRQGQRRGLRQHPADAAYWQGEMELHDRPINPAVSHWLALGNDRFSHSCRSDP